MSSPVENEIIADPTDPNDPEESSSSGSDDDDDDVDIDDAGWLDLNTMGK